MTGRLGRVVGSLCIAVLVSTVLMSATPAGADPPGPSNYRSDIISVEPATPSIEVQIIGGDSFVLLRQVEPVTIDVPGYSGEPYLRYAPNGTVERNRRSPATYLNEDRYGDGSDGLPPQADADAAPEWEVVAEDGSYAWHDHRAHWMQPDPPLGLEPGDQILDAVLPIEVDGDRVDIAIVSFWLPGPSLWPSLLGWLFGIAGSVALVVGLVTRPGIGASGIVLPGVLSSAAVMAAVTGGAQFLSLPAETEPSATLWMLPLLGLACGLAAMATRSRPATALPLVLGGSVPLVVFASLRLDHAIKAELPTSLPFWVDRVLSATALGMALVCLVAGALTFSRLLGRAPGAPPGVRPTTGEPDDSRRPPGP